MPFQTFTHNPTTVEAIQVARPWSRLQQALPFARQVKSGFGALAYFVISTPGETEVKRAYPGDWVIKYPTGCVGVQTDEQFQRYYSLTESVQGDPIPALSLAQEAELKEMLGDSTDSAGD